MGPMPSYDEAISSFNSGGAPARLSQDVQSLAPLAQTFVVPNPAAQHYFADFNLQAQKGGGVVAGVENFLKSAATGVGHMAFGAEQWLQHNVTNMITAPIRYGTGLSNAYLDNRDLNSINQNTSAISGRIQTLNNQFKAGVINSKQYQLGLKLANSEMNDLVKQSEATNNKISSDYTNAKLAAIDTASDIVTILTAGFGKAVEASVSASGVTADMGKQSAADWLLSRTAAPLLKPAVDSLADSATTPRGLKLLSVGAQKVLNRATAEVVANSADMSARQIATATAANIALKYPIIYNFMSTSSQDVYKELQNKKYGSAVNTLATNALIVLAGGIFGEAALSAAGKGAGRATAAMFGKSAFMDELSKGLFGDEKAIYNVLVDNPQYVKGLSDLEATHMARTGNDPVAAAWNVINGERAVDGVNAIDKGPLGWLEHNTDWANASKELIDVGEKLGLGKVVAGRWTSAQAKMVATELSKGGNKDSWTKIWSDLKTQYSDSAFANNPNLDAQITHYINTAQNSDEIFSKVNKIPAGRFATGIPEDIARKWAQKGFIPVVIKNIRTPFKEGEGVLSTKFANGEDFFVKTVQPLPVLRHVGAMLTGLGLSPYASTERVYQMFNQNLAENIRNTTVNDRVTKFLNDKGIGTKTTKEVAPASSTFSKEEIKNLQKQGYTPEMIAKLEKGEFSEGALPSTATPVISEEAPTVKKTNEDAADYIQKTLSDYAKHPNRKGFINQTPIRDLRQMTNADIRKAFANRGIQLSHAEAHELQVAVSNAHLTIDASIKGLGDKLVDLLYSTPGMRATERRFLRLQGIFRFSNNPFFQYGRAVPKLEILSEASGGGWVKSFFSGRTQQMKEIRQGLRDAGFLDKRGQLGNVITDEAVLDGASTRNLTKALLPAQENSIAGLVDALAQKEGVSWQDYVKNNKDGVRDLIQSIAEYDRNSQFLNSPLARTLNIAFFPFRFETKVLQIMTKSLARQDLFTKVAFIYGIVKAHDYLNSPQGQAWYAANADAIGLFKYITPVASLNEVFQSLLPGHDHSLGNFGELGGLPFGWIPQILDAEGLTQFKQPGVDAKTGAIIPQYIPKTSRGQVAIAVQDLLSSMFSYPGTTAGLPSKTGVTRNVALGIVQGSKTKDMQLNTPTLDQLSPQQQEYSQTIQAMLHGPQGSGQSPAPSPGSTQQVPARFSSLTVPHYKSSSRGSNSSTKKLKKSEFTPALLPGQTTLGQL